MQILLTNDDSHSSPLLKILIERLVSVAELTIVLPKVQQSWTSKAITRFSKMSVTEEEICGHPAFIVDGSPASCAQVGIHNLSLKKPDVVVSGINMGINAGIGLVMASGTVGACFEANITGCPAIAISQVFDKDMRDYYLKYFTIPEQKIDSLNVQINGFLDSMVTELLVNKDKLLEPITWNINLPVNTKAPYKLHPARLGNTWYKSLYRKEGDAFVHHVEGIAHDDAPDSDTTLLNAGKATLTKIDLRSLSQPL